MRPFPSVVLALLLVPGSLSASSGHRVWDFAPFSTIRRVPAEPGAPVNGHPIRVDGTALAQALGEVRLVVKSDEEPLFGPAEVAALSRSLADALSQAEPGEDLELVSTARRGPAFFNASMAVTARVFARDGKLNLIVHDARLEFLYKFALENRMPAFDYGSRRTASAVVLKAPGAESRRGDWIILPAAALAPAPQASVQPAAAPVPVPVAAPAPVALTATVEDRLRDLKRFRDQNLITEEEYTQKKQELLSEFMKGTSANP